MKNFTEKEIEIIRKALYEYEEAHYEYEDGQWQNIINDLTSYFRNINEEELLEKEKELIIDEEDIETVIEMAGFGINYWAYKAVVGDKTYTVFEEDGDKYVLSYDDIIKGIKLYIENGNKPYSIVDENEIDECQIDAEVADMIIQFACFGEIVYA